MIDRSPFTRALWFALVDWWATPPAVNVAWVLNATVVLLPLGVELIDLVTTVPSLAEPRSLDGDGGSQRSLAVRAVCFVAVGRWLSLLWADAAAVSAATVIGLSVAFWLFTRLPHVTTLYRFHG